MKIELKPNWDNAPDWANYWAVDGDGVAWWYEIKPQHNEGDNGWIGDGVLSGADSTCESWKETLQPRPTAKSVPPLAQGLVYPISNVETKLDRIIELLSEKMTVDINVNSGGLTSD